jgi:peptide chain release factor subunit 1
MLPLERRIQRIVQFQALGRHTLTLYLSTDPAREDGTNLNAQLGNLFRSAARDVDAALQDSFTREWDLILAKLGSLGSPPRGLAVFSCSALGFLEVVPLPERVSPQALWDATFQLRPLLAVIDEYERTLVVLIDKERARILRLFLGEIAEILTLADEIPGHHHQGGYSQQKFQRDHDKHVLWHTKRVIDQLVRLSDREPTDRILIGGPQEVLAELRQLLPKRLRTRIRGEVRVPLFASVADVHAAVRDIEVAAERAAETALVAELQEKATTGLAALGPASVIQAVLEQRCAILVIAAGVSVAGLRCGSCDLLVMEETSRSCPHCGGDLETVRDLLEPLAHRVLLQGGRVEEVRADAAASLAPVGGVAALLRYALAEAQNEFALENG